MHNILLWPVGIFTIWQATDMSAHSSNGKQKLPYVVDVYEVISLTHSGRDTMAAIFQTIFLNENVWISINISLKFVPMGPINNIPALVLIMAWSRPGDKPLSDPMMVRSLTHICVTRPQWVKWPGHESDHPMNMIFTPYGNTLNSCPW